VNLRAPGSSRTALLVGWLATATYAIVDAIGQEIWRQMFGLLK
jgi:hypothetical protein